MRVVGGELSGRVLAAKVGPQVRPTSDLVRGAIANMVDALIGWEDAVVTDLCCGTGGLGIEALSRGAAHVTFVDAHAASITATRQNLVALGIDDRTDQRVTLMRADVVAWASAPPSAGRPDAPVDIILVDPPYAFDRWDDLLAALGRPGVLAAEGIVVAESNRALDPEAAVSGTWDVERVRKHGGTVVTVLAHASRSPAATGVACPLA